MDRETQLSLGALFRAFACRRDARFCSRLGVFLRNGFLDRTPRPTRLAAHTFGARTAVTRFASPARGLSRRVEVPPGSPRQIRSRAAIAPERDHESPGRRRPRACCCSPPSGTFFSGELHRIPEVSSPPTAVHTARPFTQCNGTRGRTDLKRPSPNAPAPARRLGPRFLSLVTRRRRLGRGATWRVTIDTITSAPEEAA